MRRTPAKSSPGRLQILILTGFSGWLPVWPGHHFTVVPQLFRKVHNLMKNTSKVYPSEKALLRELKVPSLPDSLAGFLSGLVTTLPSSLSSRPWALFTSAAQNTLPSISQGAQLWTGELENTADKSYLGGDRKGRKKHKHTTVA